MKKDIDVKDNELDFESYSSSCRRSFYKDVNYSVAKQQLYDYFNVSDKEFRLKQDRLMRHAFKHSSNSNFLSLFMKLQMEYFNRCIIKVYLNSLQKYNPSHYDFIICKHKNHMKLAAISFKVYSNNVTIKNWEIKIYHNLYNLLLLKTDDPFSLEKVSMFCYLLDQRISCLSLFKSDIVNSHYINILKSKFRHFKLIYLFLQKILSVNTEIVKYKILQARIKMGNVQLIEIASSLNFPVSRVSQVLSQYRNIIVNFNLLEKELAEIS